MFQEGNAWIFCISCQHVSRLGKLMLPAKRAGKALVLLSLTLCSVISLSFKGGEKTIQTHPNPSASLNCTLAKSSSEATAWPCCSWTSSRACKVKFLSSPGTSGVALFLPSLARRLALLGGKSTQSQRWAGLFQRPLLVISMFYAVTRRCFFFFFQVHKLLLQRSCNLALWGLLSCVLPSCHLLLQGCVWITCLNYASFLLTALKGLFAWAKG